MEARQDKKYYNGLCENKRQEIVTTAAVAAALPF
jgi:hypothetical protein